MPSYALKMLHFERFCFYKPFKTKTLPALERPYNLYSNERSPLFFTFLCQTAALLVPIAQRVRLRLPAVGGVAVGQRTYDGANAGK